MDKTKIRRNEGMRRKRENEGINRRKNTLIKKAYEFGEFDGMDVALIICKHGRYTTYRSRDHTSWPPSVAEIVSKAICLLEIHDRCWHSSSKLPILSQRICYRKTSRSAFLNIPEKKKLPRKNEEARIMSGRQTTCKWIDNQQLCKRENKTIVMDITEWSLSALFSDLFHLWLHL